ncbi:hypothetical protein G6F31_019947 [Rhizopus arrhizus]|nr:hypothetical protein G6F31_019947 [Rhizopus arrhizus]
MYTQYVYAIEVGAALLLVGMVAAIALTLRRRRDVKATVPRPSATPRTVLPLRPKEKKNDADAGPLSDPRGDPVRHRDLRHLPEPPQPDHSLDVHRARAPGRQHELRGVLQLVRRHRRPGVRVLHPDRGRR